jgi:hypothetical protein
MFKNNFTKIGQAFPGMLSIDYKLKHPAIKIDDFYRQLYQLGIRKKVDHDVVLNLSRFLDRDKLCRHIGVSKLGDYIDACKQGNPYILSFGTKRRRLPTVIQEIPTIFQGVELKKD